MEQIKVSEANGEVLVFLDRHMGDRLNAMKEAARILGVEVLREQSKLDHLTDRESPSSF